MNTQLHQHLPAIIAILSLLSTAVFSMTAAPVSPTFKGVATIVWGTIPGGVSVAPVITGCTILSASFTPINGGPVAKIENGDGSIISKVYLDDGFEGEVECLYDSSLTYPVQGASVTVTIPKAIDQSSGVVKAIYPCTLDSNTLKFSRKETAMITFKISHNPGVEGVGAS